MFPSSSSASAIRIPEKSGSSPPRRSAKFRNSTTTSRPIKSKTNFRRAWCETSFSGCRSGNGWRFLSRFPRRSPSAGRWFCCWRFRAGSGSSSEIAPTCIPTAACPTPLLVMFSALAHRIIAAYLGLPLLPRLYYYRDHRRPHQHRLLLVSAARHQPHHAASAHPRHQRRPHRHRNPDGAGRTAAGRAAW